MVPLCNSMISAAAVTSVAASPASVVRPSTCASVKTAAVNNDSAQQIPTPEGKSHEPATMSNRFLQKKEVCTNVAEKKRAEGSMDDEGSIKTTSSKDEAKVTFDCLDCSKEFKFR